MTPLLQTRMPWAAETEVKIGNFTFNPPRLAVKAGTTVKWMNEYFCSLHPHMTATIIVEAAVGGGPR